MNRYRQTPVNRKPGFKIRVKAFVILSMLLVLVIQIQGQTLTISNTGQTGTSGTNWTTSGTNSVTITTTGDASINTSVITGYLNAGTSVILSTILDNWQQYNGSSWGAATSYPGQIVSNDCPDPMVTIQTSHQMEIQTGSSINIHNLKIENTGKLTINSGGKIFVQQQLQLDENARGAIVVESNL